MKVLVIPEDFRKDQYMLKPVVEAMLQHLGYRARVRVCQDPLLGGVSQALRWHNIQNILRRYPMVDLFLLCVDRDGETSRREKLNYLERQAAEELACGGKARWFLAENAWQEIEVWVLAGMQDLPNDWSWQDIRAEVHPKETFFTPYVLKREKQDSPGGGRKSLGLMAGKNYKRIRDLCDEVAVLESRLEGLSKPNVS